MIAVLTDSHASGHIIIPTTCTDQNWNAVKRSGIIINLRAVGNGLYTFDSTKGDTNFKAMIRCIKIFEHER